MSETSTSERPAVESAEACAPAKLNLSPNNQPATELEHLLRAAPRQAVAPAMSAAVCTAELLAVVDGQPIIRCIGFDMAAAARTTLDLHGAHIGCEVVVVFDGGDETRPIVTGVLRPLKGWPLEPSAPGGVQVDVDGERLVIEAKQQLVLRCGKASITLTKAGKVLIEGAYVSSRSTGVNRVKGGSVQLN